jgi:hypothetical protein
MDWIHLAQDKDKLQDAVNMWYSFGFQEKANHFLSR